MLAMQNAGGRSQISFWETTTADKDAELAQYILEQDDDRHIANSPQGKNIC
jgi:hypothetical protein